MHKVAFVCLGNAGRSQLATGIAEREAERRGLEIEIVTGGIDPGERVYDEVRHALLEIDVDIGDRHPRRIESQDLADADCLVTIGCDVRDILPPGWDGTVRTWELNGAGTGMPAVRSQRDELSDHIDRLFDELIG